MHRVYTCIINVSFGYTHVYTGIYMKITHAKVYAIYTYINQLVKHTHTIIYIPVIVYNRPSFPNK